MLRILNEIVSKNGNTVSGDVLITWNIPKIGEVIKNGKELRAECTRGTDQDNLDDYNFQLKLEVLENMINVFFLCRHKVYLISMEWRKPNYYHYKENYMHCILQSYRWHFLYSCDIYTIHKYHKNDEDSFNIEWKITMIDDTKTDKSFVPESQIHNDFGNLLRLGSLSDAIMKSADGEEYKVHKVFVMSRSAVLKAHFEHNTPESITNVILSPFDSAVLNEVLNFIYTDRAPKVDDMPEKLLAAADFYQLNKLKGLAEEALYLKLTVENAIEYLELADLYSCKQFKEAIQKFISDRRGKAIFRTEGWANLKSLEIVKGLVEFILK